ncbi:MAG: hypothetical protein H6718_17430 [Polyangiaceae bacterium]|nr:hypothetical protein [Polyangiaceae bacterium]MCB9609432.1 hypothetical protein [Polyangiaceae bacterium]
MSPVQKPSSRPPIDDLDDEQSEVRARVTRSSTIIPPALGTGAPTRETTTVTPLVRPDRAQLGEVLIQAKALLATLPINSRRAQLLRLAIMRRDQILLEALLNNVHTA